MKILDGLPKKLSTFCNILVGKVTVVAYIGNKCKFKIYCFWEVRVVAIIGINQNQKYSDFKTQSNKR